MPTEAAKPTGRPVDAQNGRQLTPAELLRRDGVLLLRRGAPVSLCDSLRAVDARLDWTQWGRQIKTQPTQHGQKLRLLCEFERTASLLRDKANTGGSKASAGGSEPPRAKGRRVNNFLVADEELAAELCNVQRALAAAVDGILTGAGLPNCPQRKPSILHTMAGAVRQKEHADVTAAARGCGLLSVLIAATDRQFWFKHLESPLHLHATDVLVFDSTLCHRGGAHGEAALTRAAVHRAAEKDPSVAAHVFCGYQMTRFVREEEYTFECPADEGGECASAAAERWAAWARRVEA